MPWRLMMTTSQPSDYYADIPFPNVMTPHYYYYFMFQ